MDTTSDLNPDATPTSKNKKTKKSKKTRKCDACKLTQMGKNSYIMHILGKKHIHNLNIRGKKHDEEERSICVSQYTANTTAEDIINCFWTFCVIGVQYTKSHTIVQFGSSQATKEALKRSYNINGKDIVVAPKTEETKSLPMSTMLTNSIKEQNSPIKIEEMIIKLIKEIEVNDYSSREAIRVGIERFLQQHFPTVRGVQAFVFGSSANNLGFKGCDLDLYVELGFNPVSCIRQDKWEKNLADAACFIAKQIEKSNIGVEVQAVPHARVPIVKFRDCPSGINVDLSFKNKMPYYNSELICQYTNTHELVRPYLMIIRYWAQIQVVTGGAQPGALITNYAFTMMMLWYLMYRSPPMLPTVAELQNGSEKTKQSIVVNGWNFYFGKNVDFWKNIRHNVSVMELIQEFFNFYSEVELNKIVISPHFGTMKDRIHVKQPNLNKNSPICVQDPFDHAHNITRGLKEKRLRDFQYKCRCSAKICQDILAGSLPLSALLTKIGITKNLMENDKEKVTNFDTDN